MCDKEETKEVEPKKEETNEEESKKEEPNEVTAKLELLSIENFPLKIRSDFANLLGDYILNVEKTFSRDEINELLMSKWMGFKNKYFLLQIDKNDLINTDWKDIKIDRFSDFLFEVNVEDIKNNNQRDGILTMFSFVSRFEYFFVELIIYDNKKRIIYNGTLKAYKANKKYYDVRYISSDIQLNSKEDREQYVEKIKKQLFSTYKISGKLPESLSEAIKQFILNGTAYKGKFLFPLDDKVSEIVNIDLPAMLN